MNKIYFIGASTIWPVGDPGAIVIAKDIREAKKLGSGLGLSNPRQPKCIGTTKLKAGIVFCNTTEY